jgi:hypothetical protein
MAVATQIHSSEIKQRIAQVERDLRHAKAKLPAVLRTAAEAYLAGDPTVAPDSVRLEIETLDDLLTGLRQIAVIAEYRETADELNRRERQHKKDAIALDELRREGTRAEANIEGTGAAVRLALRRDREDRNAAFDKYAESNVAFESAARAITELRAHCDELAMQLPDDRLDTDRETRPAS